MIGNFPAVFNLNQLFLILHQLVHVWQIAGSPGS